MDLRLFSEPQQGATYDDQLALARAAEAAGFSAFVRADHFLAVEGLRETPNVGPTDVWTALAGLARETTSIRLGPLLSSVTFREPGLLAVTVAQIDAMSGGRVELGLGAGWYLEEHQAYGVPFPGSTERLDRLEEQLEIITGLWDTPLSERFSYTGRYYELTNSPGLPKPVQRPRPPIVIGGKGTRRMPMIAARFADEINVGLTTWETIAAVHEGLDKACETIGRDPGTICRSVLFMQALDETEAKSRERSAKVGQDYDEVLATGLAGKPEDAVERLAEYAKRGVSRIYLQVLDFEDLDHVAYLGETLGPLVASL